MGLKLSLSWFDKLIEDGVGREYSRDFGDDCTVIEQLGLPIEVNNGEFNVKSDWVSILQSHFKHQIQYNKYNYFVSFDYADERSEGNNKKQG